MNKLSKKNSRKPRLKLFGVWLINTTDSRDDEWVGVMARTRGEAKKAASYNSHRFTLGEAHPAKKFCRRYDISRTWLKAPRRGSK
jgi:hypothetical protein